MRDPKGRSQHLAADRSSRRRPHTREVAGSNPAAPTTPRWPASRGPRLRGLRPDRGRAEGRELTVLRGRRRARTSARLRHRSPCLSRSDARPRRHGRCLRRRIARARPSIAERAGPGAENSSKPSRPTYVFAPGSSRAGVMVNSGAKRPSLNGAVNDFCSSETVHVRRTSSTFSCDIAYSDSPTASRASFGSENPLHLTIRPSRTRTARREPSISSPLACAASPG